MSSNNKEDQTNWMKPGSRILCVQSCALLSHEIQTTNIIYFKLIYLFQHYSTEKIQKLLVQCTWRIVRFVITDQQILFYKHESEYNIQTLQDVENISITSQSLAKDSFKPIQIKTLLITHESLTKVIKGLDLIVNQPPNGFNEPLLLQDISNSSGQVEEDTDIPTLIFYFQSRNDVHQISRAIQLSQSWIRYKEACEAYSLEYDLGILDWIQESISQDDLHFDVKLQNYNPEELDLYIECLSIFLMHSSAINYLKFTRDYSIDQNLMRDKHLLINVKYDQIFSLIFENCSIDGQILKNLSDVISANNNLEHLSLSHNLLTDECIPLLHKIVESCPRLNTLDLSKNLLTGQKKYFYDFIDLINLLQDDIIKDFEDFGFKLILSHNRIGDDIVDVVEKLVLFAVRPKVNILDLSYNNISKYNLWRLYKGYLKITQPHLQNENNNNQQENNYTDQMSQQDEPQILDSPPPVVLNIFPLPFHSDILNDSIAIFSKMDSDLKRQEFIRHRKEQERRRRRQLQKQQGEGDLVFNDAMDQEYVQQNQTKNVYLDNKSIDISIQRLSLGKKPLPNKKAQVMKIKEYKDKIINKAKDKFQTLEQISEFCQEINELDFEFPLRLLEPLQEVAWNKLCEALLIRDHYSVSLLIKVSKLIGLDLEFFEKYLEISEQRKISMMKKIEKFLNFDNISESTMNEELHFLIKECLRLDLRGPIIDQLFLIKEKRDQFIQQQIQDGFQPETDLITSSGSRGDCFRFLIMNEEKKKVPKSIFSIQINGNFFSHCSRADYVLLSKLSQKMLIEYEDTIDIILQKYDTNYFIDLAYRRLSYFLEDFEDLDSNNPFSIFEKIFYEGLHDLKLACARLNIQYRNFQDRNIYHQHQLQQIKAPLTERQEEIIYPVDAVAYSQQHTLTNFMYLRKFEYYFSKNEIALQNLQPSDMFQHKSDDTFIKPLIQFPVPEAQVDLEKAMFFLIKCVVVAKESDAFKKIPVQLQQLIILLNKSQFSPHLKDEVYLQIFKYSTKPDINDLAEFNIIAIVTILTIYAPPSQELNHFVRVFMFKYYGRQRFTKLAQEGLISLQSTTINEIVIPDWIPSLYEIEQRLLGYSKFMFRVVYPNSTSQVFCISPYTTAGQFMKILYNESQYFLENSITDKYNYWIYQTSIYGDEELAIMYEEILMEVMSNWNQQKFQDFSFIIKRRIYQPYHTIRLSDIHQKQLNTLLDEQLRYYYSSKYYSKSIPIPSILRIAAYYLVFILKDSPKIIIEPSFVIKQIASLIPPILKFNKEEFAIVISKMIEVEKINNLDKYVLAYNLLVQMRFHNFYCSSNFTAKLNGSELEQVFITVNPFCINIFSTQNQLKPQYSYYYEEIIHCVAISANKAIIHFFNRDSKKFSIQNINFNFNRAHEFIQDIVSYAYLRQQDDSWALYAYSELFKLRYRHSLLVQPVDLGLQDVSDPFAFELNPNLNLVEISETKDKVADLSEHIIKTSFIIPEVNDYPFFKQTTQYSIHYSERQLRRCSYQESQLQLWFNSVLQERRQIEEEIFAKQQLDNEQQKMRRDRLVNYDQQNPIDNYESDKNQPSTSQFNNTPVQFTNQQNSNNFNTNNNINNLDNQNQIGNSNKNINIPATPQSNRNNSANFNDAASNQINDNNTKPQLIQQNSFSNNQTFNKARSSLSQFDEQISSTTQQPQQQQQLQLQQQSSSQSQQQQQSYDKFESIKQINQQMGAITEVENSNQSLSNIKGKLDTISDIPVSPNPNDNLKHVNTAPSQTIQQQQSNQLLVPKKEDQHQDPQSATLPNHATSKANTNEKLKNKLFDALRKKPGAPKTEQDPIQPIPQPQIQIPPTIQVDKPREKQPSISEKSSLQSSQHSKPPQPTSAQTIKNNIPVQNYQKEEEQKDNGVPSQNLNVNQDNSEDNTLLRHSRNSSKEGLKSGSPAQSKERLKSLSRTQQTIHSTKRNTKKLSKQNSKENLNEQTGNLNNEPSSQQTIPENETQNSVNQNLNKVPKFLSKKKLI